jgi:hypothetical protein
MKKLLLLAFALIAIGSWADSPALTQEKSQDNKEAASAATKPESSTAAPKRTTPKPAALRIDPKDGRPLSPKSAASRMALCRADCRPGNYNPSSGVGIHGIYRKFADYDPHLTSAEGKKSYAECVKKCSDPLPAIYVQRAYFGAGMTSWFGMTKETCLNCHSKGH